MAILLHMLVIKSFEDLLSCVAQFQASRHTATVGTLALASSIRRKGLFVINNCQYNLHFCAVSGEVKTTRRRVSVRNIIPRCIKSCWSLYTALCIHTQQQLFWPPSLIQRPDVWTLVPSGCWDVSDVGRWPTLIYCYSITQIYWKVQYFKVWFVYFCKSCN